MVLNDIDMQIKPTYKQSIAWSYLRDKLTQFILFGGGAGGCVHGTTLVKTDQGYKKIMQIKPDDRVLSYNEFTRELCYNRVKRVFIYTTHTSPLLRVKLSTGVVIDVTSDHKFLFNDEWIPIGTLCRRSVALRDRNKKTVTGTVHDDNQYLPVKDDIKFSSQILEACQIDLTQIESFEEILTAPVYDLEVENTHNYVITEDNIIIHNSKSWLGCEWLLTSCLIYPGSKYFLGRNELKRIMKSTYITFLKVCKWHSIPEHLWKLNSQYNFIQFWNGSRIDLIDVAYKPADPLYERFGSEEYTAGWLEEVGEVKAKAFDVLKSRIGRHMNLEYDLLPKMFLTCNPKKNWVYFDFYKPWKEGKLSDDSVFIQALYNDNPYTASSYGEMLNKIKDPVLKARLMKGEWEYDNDDANLMSYDAILSMFDRSPVHTPSDRFYLSVDVARFGRDKAVIILWLGYHVRKIWYYDKSSAQFLEDKIRSKCGQYNIPMQQVVIDQDGVGGFLVDHLPGVVAFCNASRPIQAFDDDKRYRLQESDKYTFKNLRSQCYFRLADLVNTGTMTIASDIPPDIRNWLVEELESIKKKDVEQNEKKFQVISKDEIKDILGRSPDFADSLAMRCYFGLSNPGGKEIEVAIEW